MKAQELLELWQLLEMYRMTYHDPGERDLNAWLEEISGKYYQNTSGCNIRLATNPRGAGRKKKYTYEQNAFILKLRLEKGLTIRQIAQQANCSIYHVQTVLKQQQ